MVVPHKALKPRGKSATVSTGWLAQVAVRARPKRNGVMMRWRRQNFASVPQALSRGSENTHWNLSATMLSCPWSIWDSFRCLYSNTPKRSFGWIAIKIHNKIKCLKVPTYERALAALDMAPERDASRVATSPLALEGAPAGALDGTERRRQRPTDAYQQ